MMKPSRSSAMNGPIVNAKSVRKPKHPSRIVVYDVHDIETVWETACSNEEKLRGGVRSRDPNGWKKELPNGKTKIVFSSVRYSLKLCKRNRDQKYVKSKNAAEAERKVWLIKTNILPENESNTKSFSR